MATRQIGACLLSTLSAVTHLRDISSHTSNILCSARYHLILLINKRRPYKWCPFTGAVFIAPTVEPRFGANDPSGCDKLALEVWLVSLQHQVPTTNTSSLVRLPYFNSICLHRQALSLGRWPVERFCFDKSRNRVCSHRSVSPPDWQPPPPLTLALYRKKVCSQVSFLVSNYSLLRSRCSPPS